MYLNEIREIMGTAQDIQIRIEAKMTEYFYNETQHAFAETRVVTKTLSLEFLGPQPMVFKPGMPLEGQVSAMFNGIIPVGKEILRNAKMKLQFEYSLHSSVQSSRSKFSNLS